MKSFFRSLLASIIGCGLVLGGLFLVFMIFITAMSSSALSFSADKKYVMKNNSVLYLNMSGVLTDKVDSDPFLELLMGNSSTGMGLVDVISAIKVAENDDNIKGIYIYSGALSASGASLKEIRDALIKFKESDKFIVAYGDMYTQGCYYLASVADHVFLNPEGGIDLHGYSSSPMFYADLLKKVGVEMQIFKVGTFKSAVEPYTNTSMSDANKQQVNAYINDMWNVVAQEISESRDITVDQLNKVTNEAPMFKETKYSLDNKLVDELKYETDVHKFIKDKIGVEHSKKVQLPSPTNLLSAHPLPSIKSKDAKIAILFAEGTISSGSSTDGITDKRYVREIERIKGDSTIKAVVFRVNSPGGSAFASEQIWKAMEDLKKAKPIVVSMGGVAASGGYYISANADKIFAQPNTLTGSIGIFGMFPNMEGLTKKIGLTFDNVKTHDLADFGTLTRPMRNEEKQLIQSYVERGYDLFLKRCAEGRGVSTDSINAIGQGRVWSGNQALAIGLVDEIGGLRDAISAAASLAKLETYRTVSCPKPADVFQTFFATKKEEFAIEAIKDYLGVEYQSFKLIKEIKEQDYLQARMAYDLNIE